MPKPTAKTVDPLAVLLKRLAASSDPLVRKWAAKLGDGDRAASAPAAVAEPARPRKAVAR